MGWTKTKVLASLGCLFGVAAGAGVYTFDYAEGTSYLSNDPRACVNCHVMRDEFDAWQKSSHHATATCNDCHVPIDFLGKYLTKVEHGWRHSKAFTTGSFHEPIQITDSSLAVVQDNCVRCHGGLVHAIQTDARGERANCTHCHGGVGHGAAH